MFQHCALSLSLIQDLSNVNIKILEQPASNEHRFRYFLKSCSKVKIVFSFINSLFNHRLFTYVIGIVQKESLLEHYQEQIALQK